jgi:ribosomal protein S15P/S13E
MYKYIFSLIFIIGCTSQSESEEVAQHPNEDACMYLFARIINVQEHREVARKDFHITLMDKQRGKVSDRLWKKESNQWLANENRLATTANHLYEEAREHACFADPKDL